MIARIRILTTLMPLCHLLLVSGLLTSQLRAQEFGLNAPSASALPAVPQSAPANPDTAHPPAPPAKKVAAPRGSTGEPITFIADVQEKEGDVYHLRGNVEIDFRKDKLRADNIDYDDSKGLVTATGHIVYDGALHDEHITATRATYNVDTETGRFWDAAGTTGAKSHGKSVVLTTSNPFFFRGAVVDKVGPDKYVVHHGMVTSCKLPRPKWTFRASQVTVVPGDDAKLFSTSFWVWRLPVFYFPFFDHSVERRTPKTGLLMPMAGLSSTRGTIISEGLFLSITRSMNAVLGAELFSRRGWAQHADFRAWLNDRSYLLAKYYGVLDNGAPPSGGSTTRGPDQGGQEVHVNAATFLNSNIRGAADVTYLSSLVFRYAFAQSYSEIISSEVHSTGFLTDNFSGYSLNAVASRYQNFQGNGLPDQATTILHAPSFEASGVDRQLGDSPLYWSFDSSADFLSHRDPNFTAGANVAGRLDANPNISLPLFWQGWTLRPSLAVRDTWYTARAVTGGVLGESTGIPVNRRALTSEVEIRPPTLERIFDSNRLARSFKHTIEPRITYRDTTGVENFSEILRFDARDILSDTNEVEYGLTQRLYAKPVPRKDCPVPPGTDTNAVAASGAKGTPGAGSKQAALKDGSGNKDVASQEGAAPEKQPASTDQATAGKEAVPAKKFAPPNKCVSAPAGEMIRWDLSQKYFFDPFFGGALIPGQRNVFTTTVDFTGIAFLTDPRHTSPVLSRLTYQKNIIGVEWDLDYDTRAQHINSSLLGTSFRLPHDLTILGTHTFLHTPGEVSPTATQLPSKFDQFGASVYYGHPSRKGFSFVGNVDYDTLVKRVEHSGVRASYNWDCCGVTFEYGRVDVPGLSQNIFRFAFSLANVGTFGTLPRAMRNF